MRREANVEPSLSTLGSPYPRTLSFESLQQSLSLQGLNEYHCPCSTSSIPLSCRHFPPSKSPKEQQSLPQGPAAQYPPSPALPTNRRHTHIPHPSIFTTLYITLKRAIVFLLCFPLPNLHRSLLLQIIPDQQQIMHRRLVLLARSRHGLRAHLRARCRW